LVSMPLMPSRRIKGHVFLPRIEERMTFKQPLKGEQPLWKE